MRAERTGPLSLLVEFDDEAELRAEERANLNANGLFVRTAEELPPLAVIDVRLRLPGRGETTVKASVVGTPPGAVALQLQGSTTGIVTALLASPVAQPPSPDTDEVLDPAEDDTPWDRVQAMTPPQKIRIAPRGDRATRAILLLGNEPMLLFALLKNPRIGAEEVVRIAKSPSLGFQAAEFILKSAQWNSNVDVLVAMIHNAKLPLHLGLRVLEGLPENEVRVIAKGAATSAALKQAALRRLTAR